MVTSTLIFPGFIIGFLFFVAICREYLLMQFCREYLLMQFCREYLLMQFCREYLLMQLCLGRS